MRCRQRSSSAAAPLNAAGHRQCCSGIQIGRHSRSATSLQLSVRWEVSPGKNGCRPPSRHEASPALGASLHHSHHATAHTRCCPVQQHPAAVVPHSLQLWRCGRLRFNGGQHTPGVRTRQHQRLHMWRGSRSVPNSQRNGPCVKQAQDALQHPNAFQQRSGHQGRPNQTDRLPPAGQSPGRLL